MNLRLLVRPRPSDVEHLDVVVLDEAHQGLVRRRWTAVTRKPEDRFAELAGQQYGFLRAARQDGADGKDHRAVPSRAFNSVRST